MKLTSAATIASLGEDNDAEKSLPPQGSKKEHCRDKKEVAEALASYEGGSSKDRVEKGRVIAEDATRGD